MHNTYVLLQILTIALVTFLLRVLPFALFREGGSRPKFITYLGRVLPYGIMAMLVVYGMKSVSLVTFPHGIPELMALIAVVLLHLWKRNTLLSVFGGTALYMLLVQTIF